MKRQSQLQQISKTLLVSRIEKTGSLVKLQQVLGHSSLQVSLTYLRGLEVQQMGSDDMPSL
jgi:hypothetical protein